MVIFFKKDNNSRDGLRRIKSDPDCLRAVLPGAPASLSFKIRSELKHLPSAIRSAFSLYSILLSHFVVRSLLRDVIGSKLSPFLLKVDFRFF